MIKVLFFASLREQLKVSETSINFTNEVNVHDIIGTLVASDERYNVLLENDILCAVNHTLCGKNESVEDNQEIAFFPPVTGG